MKEDALLPVLLALPRAERAKLVEELLRSLDETPDADVTEAWLDEIEKRAAELDCGTVTAVDWDSARRKILDRLRERRAHRASS